ncbi:MAG TPA: TonB-dependent receptor [Candidatus Angelobacter sp.]|nr:TonB-dependent receptor [Candidatus Angelobacter sp.]
MKGLLSTLLVFSWAITATAQTFRGGIQGTVKDSTGAVITDAEIAVASVETGLTRTTHSGATGDYSLSELPLGVYTVTAKASGFRTSAISGIRVAVSTNQQVDFQLAPGSISESVDVVAKVALVDTVQDAMGGTMDADEFQQLPIGGRDFNKLLIMVPGSLGDASGESDSAGSFGLFSINGNRGRSNNYLLDGTDMNDGYRNLPAINEPGVFGTPSTILPLDALQEVSVRSNTEAEFGRSSGATVNMVTKSGTNSIHGSVYEYFRNNGLDARNFFDPVGTEQNVFHNNQYGVSLGGPFVKDKTFWFVAYEGQREGVGIPTVAAVPTQAQINQAIADNGGVVNPVIASLLARNPWPTANQPADANGNNFFGSAQANNRVDSLIAKIDQHFGQSDVLTGRYYYGNGYQSFPLGLVGGGVLPGFNTLTPTNVNVVSLSYTHIFSQQLLMELRGGYNRLQKQFFPEDQTFDPNSIGLNLGTGKQDFGLPSISVGTFAPLGATSSDPRARTDTNTQLFNNYSYSSGRHIWKFGYEFRRTVIDGFFDSGYRGSLSFSSLDNFIAGIPSSGQQAQGNSSRQTFQNNHSFYLQDNFRLFSRLSLNYGVRWEYFGVIGEEQNRFSILSPSGNLEMVHQLYPHDLNNFAPRLSLAWDIRGDGKTILRSGWGLYYDAFPQDHFLAQLPFNTFNAGPAYNGIGPAPVTFSFTPAAAIQPGVAVFAPATFSANDVFTVDQNLRTPYIQVFNLNLEHEFTKNMAVQVGYVGSQGRKLFRYVDLNQVNPATGTTAFPNLGVVNQIQTSASSSYNSLQSSLKFKNWHGLSSSVNYAWSHSIDNASDGLDFVPNASQPDNSFRPDLERASSNFDMRQHFSWIYSYRFPHAQTLAWLTSGWTADGNLTLNSGQPFNVNYFGGNFNGSGEFFGRPDVVGNPFAGTNGPGQFLNLSAFQTPCTLDAGGHCVAGTQHFGNVGRNAFIGPSYKNFDFSLAKDNKLTEKVQMQFRVDFFNFFNHPNFANPLWPNFVVNVFQNGIDPQGHGRGFLPLTTTPDVGVGDPFLGNGGSRNIQLGLRFSF